MSKITCFLPCRQGSQRVVRKNIKPFAGYEFGLIEVKLKQVIGCADISEVVLSTNDQDIIDYASSLESKKLRIHRRDDALSSSETSTDQLISHALDLIPEGDILWTHVTSPFITSLHYSEIIKAYRKALEEGCDSLMTVTALHAFLWQEGRPLNYDRSIEKWPRTQTLKPIHEINSGVFLAPSDLYRTLNDRIGLSPLLYPLDKLVGFDVDWPEDFAIAQCLVEKELLSL